MHHCWKTTNNWKHVLQDFEKKNTELWVFYNKAKDKNTEIEDEQQEYINKNAEQTPSNGEQKTLQRLYNQVQYTNIGMEEETKEKTQRPPVYASQTADIKSYWPSMTK